jgi:hypothetical protein
MVYLTSLWLPILVSAVVVFFGSAILHMVLSYHKSDYSAMPGEDNVRAAMRQEGVRPGHYYLPHCVDPKEMANPAVKNKFDEGPVAFVTVLPSGVPSMGKSLISWFVYCLVLVAVVAYLAGRTLAPGTEYLTVFRVVGTAAFLGFSGATASESIWKGMPWSVTLKHLIDGLVYSLLTAGVFAWLWPS